MAHTMIDSKLFRNFCGTERAREIWSDENMLTKWFEFWAALAQAEEEMGIVPSGTSAEIRKKGKVENLDLDKATVESFVYSEHMKYDTDPFKNSVIKMWNKMGDFDYIPDTSINIEDHINTSIYQKALESLIEDYPDEQFFKDKLAQFQENNF